ncbi:transposase, Ptta/En/Spm [Tanacetum coccineum]|uniref:Transposase, Ptta/En/Spm n=1 Tax=Tanacetum coccineum TaxID=301880 RepID=A0ABQ5B7L3_9ASTR
MPNTRGRSRGSHPKSVASRSTPTGRGGSSIVGRGREIANKWCPIGRGNNSSSGNGRDIPDECSPIGRGSNNTSGKGRGRVDDCSPRGRGSNNNSGKGRGRADDCSPRGRGSNNTSGNGSDISDDCSPRGRGSNSIGGRGNESADEWSPTPDILGEERLDVHEDGEEHVECLVGSLQNQVGSNVTPSSSLPKLWLVGGVFYDHAISHHAVRLFKTMFKGAYTTWTKVPQDHRDRYSDIMRSVRKAAMKVTIVNDNVDIGRMSSNRPNWIGVNDWQPMVNVWDTDEWRLKSKIAKENRAKSQSGKHTAGSRSFLHTKIVMVKGFPVGVRFLLSLDSRAKERRVRISVNQGLVQASHHHHALTYLAILRPFGQGRATHACETVGVLPLLLPQCGGGEGYANVMDRSIGIDIPVCLGLTLVKQTQFHLSQLRMSRVGHLHGLIYDDTGVLYYGIYGVCIGILACRGLSLVSSPLHAMKSQSQIQSSAAVNLGV